MAITPAYTTGRSGYAESRPPPARRDAAPTGSRRDCRGHAATANGRIDESGSVRRVGRTADGVLDAVQTCDGRCGALERVQTRYRPTLSVAGMAEVT